MNAERQRVTPSSRPEPSRVLRRYLMDEALLSRARGEYWRSGGPVDVG